MVAAEHREVAARVRITAFFNILHPCPIDAHPDVMLFFARDRAGVTTDAAVLINDKSVAHDIPFESANLILTKNKSHLDSREKQEGSTALERNSLTVLLIDLSGKHLERFERLEHLELNRSSVVC